MSYVTAYSSYGGYSQTTMEKPVSGESDWQRRAREARQKRLDQERLRELKAKEEEDDPEAQRRKEEEKYNISKLKSEWAIREELSKAEREREVLEKRRQREKEAVKRGLT